MLKTYKILSLLLSYPGPELQEFLRETLPELRNEALLSPETIDGIENFINRFTKMDLTEWQAEYVQLFDYSRSASMHLFEHIHGDSKDRGQAMVNLLEFYRENGMQLSANELPDYIPAFLEFLSTMESQRAAELLAEPVHIIHRIHHALKEKDNPYQHVLAAIVSLSSRRHDEKATELVIRFSGDTPCDHCKK